nr:MAG: putative RNA-dependent RNA polymerase [Narnaviridae sp.]
MQKSEEPLRSLDAEHHNQATLELKKLRTSFKTAWHSHTVQTIITRPIRKGNYHEAFEVYSEIRRADIGTPLDTHPLEDVQKAVAIISQYSEMVHSYAQLLDAELFGSWCKRRYSDCLYNFLQSENLMKLIGFTAGLNHFGLLEKYCKWSSASLWAWGLKQDELPPTPSFMQQNLCKKYLYLSPGDLWVSRMRRTNRVVRNARDFLPIFFKDLYNCKGAAAAVGPEFIENALKTHKEILTQPKIAPTPIGDDQGDDYLLDAISESARVIFGDINSKQFCNRLAPSRFPSLNSSYSSRIKDGGAGAEILRECAELDEYYMLSPEEGFFFGFASNKCDVFEVRTPYDPEIWYEAEKRSEARALAKAAAGLGVDAQVIPLSEPFKVRTITKGDSDMYHLARRWQKVIHNKMRKNFSASLMGQPCSAAYLAQVFYNNSWFDFKNQEGFFVSGDYESATDLLNPELSLWAQNEISSRLRIPIEHQRVLNACLTEHNLYYGEKNEDGTKVTHKQTWGQLMGSPTSFPVLCLINLAATKLAYELYETERLKAETKVTIPMNELPMCVNGDDILFWCHSKRHYQIWKDVTANAGLKFSLGKNYTSRRFCIINSEMYRHQPTFDLPFAKVPCINTRLLEGGSRSSVTTHFPLHHLDCKTLLSDPLFDRSKHLKRFCTVDPHLSSEKNLQNRFKDSHEKAMVWQSYASWFKTIEQRRAVLLQQASEPIRSRQTFLETLREVQVKQICEKRFNDVQMRRLNEFRAVLGNGLGGNTSYTLPQSLGGFGFRKRADHKDTVQDLQTSALMILEPKMFRKAVKAHQPKLAQASFMRLAAKELNFITKYLGVEEKVEIQQYSSYQVVDNSFFELSILAGFLSPTNLCIDIDEREIALESVRHHAIPVQRLDKGLARHWNVMTKGSESRSMKKQLEADLKNGIERVEQLLLRTLEEGYEVRCYRPVPKLR